MPPRLHNGVNSENNQSNEKFRDFNFSLKPVTVADETTVSGREFQTLTTQHAHTARP